MNGITGSLARAVADLAEGHVMAAVDIAVPPERVFAAIVSDEITKWWVRPGIFDTREWTGEVREGGRWTASGITRGQPYVQQGEFLQVDSPRRLVHTWDGVGTPERPSTVTYALERTDSGTRLTLHHAGFTSRERCNAFALGWESSLERLAEVLAPEFSADRS